jgi:hypothetical protein
MTNNLELGYQIELSGDIILLRKDGETFKCIQADSNTAIEQFKKWNLKLKEHISKEKIKAKV